MQNLAQKLAASNQTKQTKTKTPPKSQNGSSPKIPNDGYRLKINNQTKSQKGKTHSGQDPYEDIISFAGITFYPQWKGSITNLQDWIMSAQGGSKFHLVNTNSMMSRLGNLSINYYATSGSFQINKGRGPFDDVTNMVSNFKTWLTQNHDETIDMNLEADDFLERLKIATHTKQNTQMLQEEPVPNQDPQTPVKQGTQLDLARLKRALNTALEKTYIKPINDAAAKNPNKSLYEERYEHVTAIWNTIVDHKMRYEEFPEYQDWITQYTKDHIMKYPNAAITWYSKNIPRIHEIISETFKAQNYTPIKRPTGHHPTTPGQRRGVN